MQLFFFSPKKCGFYSNFSMSIEKSLHGVYNLWNALEAWLALAL